jgi:hypothetical protein
MNFVDKMPRTSLALCLAAVAACSAASNPGPSPSPVGSSASAESATTQKLPFVAGTTVKSSDVLGDLASKCDALGTAASFVNGECTCTNKMQRFYYFPDETSSDAVCLDIDYSGAEPSLAGVSDPAVLETTSDLFRTMTIRIGDGTPSAREALTRGVAAQLESMRPKGTTILGGARTVGTDFVNFDSIHHLIVGKPTTTDLEVAVLAALAGVHYIGSETSRGPGSYAMATGIVEPDTTRVSNALGIFRTAGETPELLNPSTSPSSPSGGDNAWALYEAYRTTLPTAFADDRDVTYTTLLGDGCLAGVCRAYTAPIPVRLVSGEENPRFHATIERVYVYGSIAREVIWLQEVGRFAGFMVTGPNRGAGLIGLVDHAVDRTHADMTVRAFDRKWNSLGTVTVQMPSIPNYADIKTRARFVDTVLPEEGSALTLCDLGFAGFDAATPERQEVFRHILFGAPADFGSDGKLLSGSIFGWDSNRAANANDYLSGMGEGVWNYLVYPAYSTTDRAAHLSPGHALSVALAAVRTHESARSGDSELRRDAHALNVIPISADRCFDLDGWQSITSWRPRTSDPNRKSLTKVVNMSFAISVEDATQCPDTQATAIDSTENDILWVAAAGNHANEARTKKWLCPHRAMREPRGSTTRAKKNTLVVAALDPDGKMSAYSNKGVDLVDIAAEGTRPETPGVGAGFTSFASPRVAAVATLVAQANPKATPAQLRKAILFGSKSNRDLKTSVLGGNVLNERGALRFARCWFGTIVPLLSSTRRPSTGDHARCVDFAMSSASSVPGSGNQEARDRVTELQGLGEQL